MLASFPIQIELNFIQKVRKNLVWENRRRLVEDYAAKEGIELKEDELFYLVCYEPQKYQIYNPFEKADLIPSLVRMVEEVRRGKDKKELIKKWTEQWGFIDEFMHPYKKFAPNLKNLHEIAERVYTHPWIPQPKQPIQQSLEKLWNKAERFANLWVRYRHVTNRQLDNLTKWIRFEKIDYGETKSEFYVTAFFDGEAHRTVISNTLDEIEKDPLYFYQAAGFEYILHQVTLSTHADLKPISINVNSTRNQDIFKIHPCLEPHTLLEAMYLQFFMLLCSNNKKICANYKCNKPFEPNRIDQQYCSETCKNTEKSRRQRQRKKARSVFI